MTDARGSTGTLWGLLVGGTVLQLAGWLAAGAVWDTDESFTLAFMLIVAGIGSLMALVAVVGFGVYLGHQAHGAAQD